MSTPHASSFPHSVQMLDTAAPHECGGARLVVLKALELIQEGHLRLRTWDGEEYSFGTPGTSPAAAVRIDAPDFFSRILRNPSLALGESYMQGAWRLEQGGLVDFLGVLLHNKLDTQLKEKWFIKPLLLLQRLLHTPLSLAISRRCIAHHYDLGNDFFRLMLDSSLAYSCGYQLSRGDSLEQMQEQKYALICRKLGLREGAALLDIGCGWGGMLLHAAREHGVRGLGITLSREQAALARERFREHGLEERLSVELRDYRETEGSFDYLVSIGMFEHVGKPSYRTFMRRVKRLLKNGGAGLLHTIGLTDPPHVRPDPWIAKHIFPGARLPRLHEIIDEMHRAGLTVGHVENLKLHYAETLRLWHANFQSRRKEIGALGPQYDDRFMRMWEYYLQCCEAAFRYSTMQLYQLIFCNGDRWTLPLRFDFKT